MIEIILLLVIAVLCGLVGWMDYNNRKERKDLLNMLVAKDNSELVNLTLADKTEIKAEKPREEKQDLVPLGEITDDEFDEHILDKENG
jgi:hypothetical protein